MTANGSEEQVDGEFFESIQVRADDRGSVLEALRRVMHSMGFQPVLPDSLPAYEDALQDELEVEARRFYVGPTRNHWVSILPSADLPEQLATAQRLSEETHTPSLVLNLHNGDVFYYWIFDEGRLVDQYDSNPGYFKEPRSPEELEAVRGHPARWRQLFPAGVEPEDVERILTQTFEPDQGEGEPDGDELVLWGDEQAAEFAQLLRIPNASHSYSDAKLEGLDGFVEDPEEFVEVAFAPPMRTDGA